MGNHSTQEYQRTDHVGNYPICVIDELGQSRIYFKTKRINVDGEKVKATLNGLVFKGSCIGYDVSRLSGGEIRVYFNPTFNTETDRKAVTERMTEILQHDLQDAE